MADATAGLLRATATHGDSRKVRELRELGKLGKLGKLPYGLGTLVLQLLQDKLRKSSGKRDIEHMLSSYTILYVPFHCSLQVKSSIHSDPTRKRQPLSSVYCIGSVVTQHSLPHHPLLVL